MVGWQAGAWRAGTSAIARRKSDLVLTRSLEVMQPRALVVPPASLLARMLLAFAAVVPPWIPMRMPRMPCPASVTQAVTTANVRLPRFCRLAVIVSRIGRRTKDVLWAALAGLGVAVPGVYGTKTPFHG